MADKTFVLCGLSTHNGNRKLRFANNPQTRISQMKSVGHSKIILVHLETAMTKLEAVQFIAVIPQFQDLESQTIIAEYLNKHEV